MSRASGDALGGIALTPGQLRWSQMESLAGAPEGLPLFVSNNPEHVSGYGVLAGVPFGGLSLSGTVRKNEAPSAEWSGDVLDPACPNGGMKKFGAYMAHILPSSLGSSRRFTFAVVAETDANITVRGQMGTTDWSLNGAPRTTRTDWLGAVVAKSFFFGNDGTYSLKAPAGKLTVIDSLAVTSLVEGRFQIEADACVYPFTIAHGAELGGKLPGSYAKGDVKWPGWYQGQGYGRAAGVYEADGWRGSQTIAITQAPSVRGIGLLTSKESMRALGRHGDSATELFGNYGVLYDQTLTIANETGACADVDVELVSYVDRDNQPDRTPTVQFFNATAKVTTPSMFWNGPLYATTSAGDLLYHPVLNYAPNAEEVATPTLAVASMRETVARLHVAATESSTVRVRLPVPGYIVAPMAITANARPCPGAPSTCGALTSEGVCSADRLSRCNEGQVETIDCQARGTKCGWDDVLQRNGCLASTPSPAPESNGCGGLTYEGTCAGDALSWCESGELRTQDCAAQGKVCGWNAAQGYNDCVAPAATPQDGGCGAISFEGSCDGSMLSWCDQGQINQLDCAAEDKSCAWNESKAYFDCL